MALARSAPQILSLINLCTAVLLLSACVSSSDSEIDFDGLSTAVEGNGICAEFQLMEGDPNHFGPALGFNCISEVGDLVAFRIYGSEDERLKAMNDWVDVVSVVNPIATGQDWFAIGPAELQYEIFDGLVAVVPSGNAPATRELTGEEANRAACSSLVYYVANTALTNGDSGLPEIQQYFESIPGLEQLVERISDATNRVGSGFEVDQNELRTEVYLTTFDDEVKALCSNSSG